MILRPERPPSNEKTPLLASRVAPSSMRIMFREEVVRIYKAKDGRRGRRGRETDGHALFAFASLPPPPSKLGLNALPLHRRVQRAEKLPISSYKASSWQRPRTDKVAELTIGYNPDGPPHITSLFPFPMGNKNNNLLSPHAEGRGRGGSECAPRATR